MKNIVNNTAMENNKNCILSKALSQLSTYINEAKQLGNENANCCFLATSDNDKCPNGRIITIQDINDSSLLFLANRYSGKIIQLKSNPQVGLCFYWPEIKIQVTIEGSVTTIKEDIAKTLWNKRDYYAQVSAWTANSIDQSDMERQKREIKRRFDSSKLPMANSWSGFSVQPHRLEFCHTDWKKTKKRECFKKSNQGWIKEEYY